MEYVIPWTFPESSCGIKAKIINEYIKKISLYEKKNVHSQRIRVKWYFLC